MAGKTPQTDWIRRFHRMDDELPDLPADSDAARLFLLAGNARFIAQTAADIAAPSTATPSEGQKVAAPPLTVAPKQAPLCVVLGCADARVPAELVFDAKPNQLFVVRVAGNVLGDECLGSIEYALASFPSTVRLIVVLGHTGCGAVGAAVDTYLDPKMHGSIAFTRSLRSVVNHILLAVRSASLALIEAWGQEVTSDPGYRAALIEAAVYLNTGMTAYQLQQEIRSQDTASVQVVYAIYDVATCRVIGPDLDPTTDDTSKLAQAPSTPDDLVALGRQVATSPMVRHHLAKTSPPRSSSALS